VIAPRASLWAVAQRGDGPVPHGGGAEARSGAGHHHLHGHGHGHGHRHGAATRASARHAGRLRTVFVLVVVLAVLQGTAALVLGSLALLSDTGHVATDAVGIGLALAAVSLATRAGRGGQRTFGLYRLEILAALANAVLLLGVAAFVLVEAWTRIGEPPDIDGVTLLLVGGAGLGVNVVSYLLLREGARESLNVRGAQLEVLADLAGSIGVVLAAVLIAAADWHHADTVIGAGIAVFIAPRALRLAGQSLRILVQAAPPHLDVRGIRADLESIDGVVDVHDLHVWTLTSDMEVVSAHLMVGGGTDLHGVLDAARAVLRDRHAVAHATLQVEPDDHEGCAEVDW
jgi:cobalt-zinc-cadmium efflux system protein